MPVSAKFQVCFLGNWFLQMPESFFMGTVPTKEGPEKLLNQLIATIELYLRRSIHLKDFY